MKEEEPPIKRGPGRPKTVGNKGIPMTPMQKRLSSKYHRSWNSDSIPKVVELMEAGGSIAEACVILKITRATFYRWMKCPNKQAFAKRMGALLEASEAWWIGQGRQNIANKAFNSSLYNLNMSNRWKWNTSNSETVKVVHETKNVKSTIDVQGLIDKAEDNAKKMRDEGETPILKEVGK